MEKQRKEYSLGLIVTEELKRTAAEDENAKLLTGHTLPGLPTSVDWRKNPNNFVTPIQDQGSCGSCVAFGTTAAVEACRRIKLEEPEADVKLSEADLFSTIGNCQSGSTLEKANSRCQSPGVCPEKCWPYGEDKKDCCDGNRFKTLGAIRLSSDAAAKDWLATNGPIQAAMHVNSDFFDVDSDKVYHEEYGDFAGDHCVCIIGYDDTNQCWIGKNSWGTSWGASGFFRIGYGESGILRDFVAYGIKVGTDKLSCSITPSPAVMVVGGSLQLNGNPTGGKPPYQHEWIEDAFGDNYINNTTIQNPVFSRAPIGNYTYSYEVTDSLGTTAVTSIVIKVMEKPPVKPDVAIRKAGTVAVRVLYVKNTVDAKTTLVVNGKDLGSIKKLNGKTIALGKFAAGDTIGFALNTPLGLVQQNTDTDLGWAGLWYVSMSSRSGVKGSDVNLYVKETNTKTAMEQELNETIDQMLSDLILEAMNLVESKHAIEKAILATTSEPE